MNVLNQIRNCDNSRAEAGGVGAPSLHQVRSHGGQQEVGGVVLVEVDEGTILAPVGYPVLDDLEVLAVDLGLRGFDGRQGEVELARS
jgi:hypothetical protein